MKFKLTLLVLILALVSGSAFARNDPRKNRSGRVQKKEQSMPAQSSVLVSLCMLSGNVNVRGWEKNEVLARAEEGTLVQLKRSDAGVASTPAAKVEVLVVENGEGSRTRFNCQASSDVELSVPRGATVHVQTRDGDIDITDVAYALAGSQNGNISVDHISQATEAGSIGGSISVKESAGRIDLSTVGGTVAVTNVRPVDSGDIFEVITVSGDVELLGVLHSQLNLRTVSGNMKLTGPLQPDGRYGVSTMSGDVTFALPADASFRLSAKVASGGDIITDFPLTLLSQSVSRSPGVPKAVGPTPKPPSVHNAPKGQPPSASVKGQPPSTPSPKNPPATPSPKGHATSAQSPVSAPAPPRQPAPTPVVNVTPRVTVSPKVPTVVKVDPVIVVTQAESFRRVTAVCGTGDAVISVASFSGTLHLQKQ